MRRATFAPFLCALVGIRAIAVDDGLTNALHLGPKEAAADTARNEDPHAALEAAVAGVASNWEGRWADVDNVDLGTPDVSGTRSCGHTLVVSLGSGFDVRCLTSYGGVSPTWLRVDR
jgi:hypothetical protein